MKMLKRGDCYLQHGVNALVTLHMLVHHLTDMFVVASLAIICIHHCFLI